ncbi:hypothetical protein MMC30_004493 [Trapelia coarctata]|nr:hypothetical protein [Trapelia coarctata]
MTEAAALQADSIPPPKKHKPSHTSTGPTASNFTKTIRSLPYTYLHLTLLSPPLLSSPSAIASPPIDALTVRRHLTSALNQFLGITGTAISIDILKVEGRDCWIHVPREDGQAVVQALTAWTGEREGVAWRIKGRGGWLGGVARGGGRELFEN